LQASKQGDFKNMIQQDNMKDIKKGNRNLQWPVTW